MTLLPAPKREKLWLPIYSLTAKSTHKTSNLSARLAQSVERETLNLKVAGSTPASGSIPDVALKKARPFILLVSVRVAWSGSQSVA